MNKLLMGLFALTLLPLGSANAAEMEVWRKDGVTYVAVDGKIEKGDGDRFSDLIKREKVESAVIFLQGPGGFMKDAMAIGMIVHERGWITFVGDEGRCSSACADIWLAGKVRYVSEAAKIGVHAPSVRNLKTDGLFENKKLLAKGNAMITAYYRRLGLTEAAIDYLQTAKGDKMNWLNSEKADEVGIVIHVIKSEEKKDAERCSDENGKSIVCGGERRVN